MAIGGDGSATKSLGGASNNVGSNWRAPGAVRGSDFGELV